MSIESFVNLKINFNLFMKIQGAAAAAVAFSVTHADELADNEKLLAY